MMLLIVIFVAVGINAAPLGINAALSLDLGPSGQNTSSTEPQRPFRFPLSNGFPNIEIPSPALSQIEQTAHGTLPNSPLPVSLAENSTTTWQLIAFNELFEVAFFTSLIENITSGVFDVGENREYVLNTLTAIQAQEQLHALGANAILQSAGRKTVRPCEYVFPTTDFSSAISLASTFTDLVLGSLQDGLREFGNDNDAAFLPLIGSVIGQEAEQNGFYRLANSKLASALPFLTRSNGQFLFSSVVQNFVVPGSCGNIEAIHLPISKPLRLEGSMFLRPADQTLRFTFEARDQDPRGLSLVYINQQNVPVVQEMDNVRTDGRVVTFEAAFPYSDTLMNGVTVVALTATAGPFATADDVAMATVFGPALIEVD